MGDGLLDRQQSDGHIVQPSARRRNLACCVAVVVALIVASPYALGSGIDSEDSTSETRIITLQPGDNLIGWVAEPIGIEEVFAAIPEAQLIYRWVASSRTWQYAIRGVGGSLTALEPGMAAMIRIDGARPVQWEQPLTPAKGMVTLYRGVNWVTWVGRDEWPLDQVARGIGKSLVSVRVDDVTWPAPLDAILNDLPVLRRGDPVQVTVSRDLRWLQPTGMMPKIVPVGDISESLQEDIRADVRGVLDFFAEKFAIETDFSTSTVMIYSDFDAAVEHERAGEQPSFGYTPEWLLSSLTSGRTAQGRPWGFWLSACGWMSPVPQPCHGRTYETLAHEWFHLFQSQLSGRRDVRVSPVWMNEGAATWAEWQLPAELRSEGPAENARHWRLERVKRHIAPLGSAGNTYTGWNYDLGSFAVEQLVEVAGIDAAFEFNRQLYPQVVGRERFWEQGDTFQDAFEAAFGLRTTQFYRQYAAWRDTLPMPSRRSNYSPDDVELRGSLHFSDGSPATGFIVLAEPYEGDISAGIERAAVVDDEGNFTLEVAPNTTQRIWLTRQGCELWLTNAGWTMTRPQAGEYRDIDTRQPTGLELPLPEGACENELRARVTTLRGDDRFIEVLLIDAETGNWFPTRLGASGSYTGFAPKAGEYRVRIRLDDCGVFYSRDGVVGTAQDADVLELSSEPVSIEFALPHDMCVWQISGRVVNEVGDAVGGGWIQMQSHGLHSSGEVASNGRFAIEVPDAGDYVLFTGTELPDCYIVYASSGGSADWRQAELIAVADKDITGIVFVVPQNPADLCR